MSESKVKSILVISDSHGRADEVEEIVGLYSRAVSAVVHLGDVLTDIQSAAGRRPGLPFYLVRGNCDINAGIGEAWPTEAEFFLGGKKVLCGHGHVQRVKSGLERVCWWAAEREADLCLFGHTHFPVSFMAGGTLMFNPGSLGRPWTGKASYGVISIARGKINAKHVYI